jgi:hypothetical protein
MAINIDWANRIINVPKADMTLIQLTPIEIRELELNAFRLTLKDLEDDADGMTFPYTHNHNTTVDVGGITLARVVEITNGYTVTFENGAYVVNAVGANSNLVDRLNPNNVSVRTANSAGLVQTREIEQSAFGGEVVIRAAGGTAGTTYPIGTLARPCSNLADAILIAETRSLHKLRIRGDLTVGATDDVSGYELIGDGASIGNAKTTITLTPGCVTDDTSFTGAFVQGTFNGRCALTGCVIGEVENVYNHYDDCAFVGPVTVPAMASPGELRDFHYCHTGETEFIYDTNGAAVAALFVEFAGRIRLMNVTNASAHLHVEGAGATITVDASCTAGEIEISGIAKVVNESVLSIDTDKVMSTPQAVWDESRAMTVGKFVALK